MNKTSIALAITAVLTSTAAFTQEQEIERIEIKAELLPTDQSKAAKAVDVLTAAQIEKLAADHVQDLLQQVGNINYASGSSRARYFQMRGIGERSQFVDPVNPSVGVAIDRIDYTDMANAATVFDIEQVEVLKGPQGTSLGANAMAGFINLTSTEVGSSENGKVRLALGNYGYQQLASAFGGDIGDEGGYRVSVNKTSGDGYIENIHLGRDDTNGFDELSFRGKAKMQISDVWQSEVVLHKFDINNGYDAFSLDLNRTTYSDQPGFDNQNTTAFALTNTYTGLYQADAEVFISLSNSELEYGYDEDWAFGQYNPDWSFTGIHPDGYASTDHYFRDLAANQFDVRFSGKNKNWVVGLYRQQKQTDLLRQYTWNDSDFTSDYQLTNMAVYGEGRYAMSDALTVSAGLRIENYSGDYSDSNMTTETTDETMVGGHLTANNKYSDLLSVYVRLSRGYKAGGINGEALSKLQDEALSRFHGELIANQSFESEVLNNIEMGIKANNKDNSLKATATLFYSARDNMQLKQWLTDNAEQPVFVGYISNTPSGANYGVETSLSYQVNQQLTVNAGLSLLETELDNITRLQEDPQTGLDVRVDISSRDQAHAPGYQYFAGLSWDISNSLKFDISYTGKGSYYYSYSHDEQADSNQLLNASLLYQGDVVDVRLWARNLTDETYAVRGFYFGNDPRDGYTAKNYEQFGEPRVIGVTIDYLF